MNNFYMTIVRVDGSCNTFPGLTESEALELFNSFTRARDTTYVQYGRALLEPTNRYVKGASF